MGDVDELDMKIIKELRHDGRQSYRSLAEKLDVATGTIQARVKRMEDRGVITGYHAVIDFSKLGYGITAIIGIVGRQEAIRELYARLAKLKNVFGVYAITGEYDIMVSAKFRDIHELNEFFKDNFTLEGVEKTVSFLVLETIKEKRGIFE